MCVFKATGRLAISYLPGTGTVEISFERHTALLIDEICLYLIAFRRDRWNRFDDTGFLSGAGKRRSRHHVKEQETSRPRRIETKITRTIATL